ncbi:hypothetical protein [Streptomyces profundus]|uniref:hypothetical protein n=1 Tax=Streptomyces profundus TaxID=2867410 RepID=UPI001D16615B|nr:hypothetical protein [Streptomyces sp. MA3_2.13]UED87298.1 hypothetical protein K4G22_26355 [Streptomyces sp. MA3_2.13]
MAGQHGDGQGGLGSDGLPGTPYEPPQPSTDGSAPAGEGQHREGDDHEDGA